MNLAKFLSIVLLLTLALAGYVQGQEKAQKKEDPSTVLAKVGDRVITLFDLEQALLVIPSEQREDYTTPEGRKDLLQKLIDLHLFEMEARKAGLDKDPAVKTQLATMEQNFLARQLVLHFIRQERKPPSEDDLKVYYQNHINEFKQQEEVLARHILVRTKKEAEEILALIKNGADFAQLAQERSIAPDASKGGLLGWFPQGKMVPSFEKAAFSLKKGEVSDVVWTRFGYHIIKLDDHKPAVAKPFEQVHKDIYAKMVKATQDEAVETLRKRAMNKVNVEILDKQYVLGAGQPSKQ